ncbi:uncharacterized protein TM35_000321890 [Trypanosoma theileri]|uniref:Flagellum attachment zone protein 2 n=1 Tax=Trypanosoma theileri TaxID=67003 RepID=A0A1X0NMA2_9TRYP|nr:uncharacterized protein TM35_000321890 [Trypanosoma theileri]ORC85874.1 hypothetical protein TM35_000321890 [Trypanosoma theileri]
MEEDYPVSLAVELAPENGSLLLPGSITITRTTLSVFKICDMNDEEPLFIGVCSVPLLRFARQRSEVFRSSNALLLMSLSDHLFINAALSAGIAPLKTTGGSTATSRSTSTGLYTRTPKDDRQVDKMQQLDSPSTWTRLRLEFPKPEDCDRCMEALLARNAENATSELNSINPLGGTPSVTSRTEEVLHKPRSHRESASVSSIASLGSRNRDGAVNAVDQQSDIMHSCRSLPGGDEISPTASNIQRSLRKSPSFPINSRRELETQSDANTPRNVQQARGITGAGSNRPEESQREILTLDKSVDNPGTPRSSHHSRGLPARSNPTDSRRELESASGARTPRSLRESQNDRFAAFRIQDSEKGSGTPRESQDGRHTPRSSHHSRGLPARSNPTDSRRELESASGARTPRSLRESRNSPIPPPASTSAATAPAAAAAAAAAGTASTHSFSSRPHESKREVLTPHESQDGRNTPRSSHHSRGLPARSNPTDSRREQEVASGLRTPRSLRESQNDRYDAFRVQDSERGAGTPRESQDGRNTPRSSHHSRGLPARSNPTDSRRELESASGARTPRSLRESQNDRFADLRVQDSERGAGTPRESQDGRNTPRSSHHSRGLPARSNPTDSRRELESASGARTPRSLRESQNDRFADLRVQDSERGAGTPRESQDGRNTPRSSHHSRGLPARSNPTDSRRELDTASGARTPKGSTRDGGRGTPRDPLGVNKAMNENMTREVPTASGPARYNGRDVDAERELYVNSQPHSYAGDRISAANTQRSGKNRTEYQYLLRNVMKLMHHRLHFMQYLHKELVHEAYLVEEAKLLGPRARGGSRSASMSRSFSRPTSAVSPRSPRRTLHSSVAEESSRLREIEERLRAVEELHREAELDRREAERTRRDVEREKSELDRERRELDRLRRETEEKLESITRRSAGQSTQPSPSRGASEMKEFNSIRSLHAQGSGITGENHINHKNGDKGGARRSESLNKYPMSDLVHPLNQSKPQGSDVSQGSRYSNPMVGNGQVALAPRPNQQQLQVHQPTPPVPAPSTEVEYSTAILDRYIYGDEWHLLYPGREADVRFNALIDVCLTLKLPRRLVTITSVSVDQPGLRVTAEIYHNRDSLPREVLERRFSTQPFYFLQRFYELRHYINGEDTSVNPALRGGRHGSRIGSRGVSPRVANRSSSSYLRGLEDDIVALGSEDETNPDSLLMGPDDRTRDILRRNDERGKQRERELLYERERRHMAMQLERLQQQLDRLEENEAYRRSRIVLAEAQERQNMVFDGDLNHRHTFAMSKQALEEKEHLERAMVEVGYARQSQAIAQAQRRNLAIVRMLVMEKERRARIMEQEQEEILVLDLVMNPLRHFKTASQPEVDERMRRQRLIEAEAKQRAHIYANINGFIVEALQDEMEALVGDEMTVRMMITADEMKERIDLVCGSKAPLDAQSRSRGAAITPETWAALLNEEAMEREQLCNDEERRRRLFQREYIVTTEDVTRNEIELNELDEHIAMLDDIVQQNRAMLERRRQERNHLVKLTNEEQFYRKGILTDEQDAWEMFMELFDSELHDVLLAENARLSPAPDLESPQRRRRTTIGTPRQTKPFHYMTFALEDMEHGPTAALAIEGILGCSINKNLEVTSIARPLPKVEEEELQFQAGDMILDVAGFSLHSLSHLREVLGNRAMQIQHEARVEFPDVPEEELTVNPALQKYVEVLCEHHNFLVQVLRGCDIFQIIVKS